MDPLRLGILGWAHGHADAYCAVWREKPDLGVRVTALWDRDPARLEAGCAKNGFARCASAAELLARPDVDAVLIASETAFHADLVEQAAAAGKPVVLQKPAALTLAEADRIVAAVRRHRIPFTLAWQMRVDPHNLQMRELLAGGRFGRLLIVRRRHCLCTQKWAWFEKSWHVQPELNRDIFADDAAHPVDFLLWLHGKPASVTAELGSLGNPLVPNDNGIALFRWADGAFGEVSCSFAAVAGENTTEIVCEKGTIVQNFGELVSSMNPRPPGGLQLKWFHQDDGRWTVSDLPEIGNHGERIRGLAAPIAEFLQGKRPPLATAEEGRLALEMVLACYESASQGRRVALT